MLTCKETARLVSESLDRKLSLWQRMNLRLHLMMCGACSAYRGQVRALNRLVRMRFSGAATDSRDDAGPRCPDESKRRIAASLREHIR